jgi:8-hydroxy-5-deazaflavin:NADPH oxidoreductase
MRIAVIGSGRIGATAARLLAQAGHEVRVANSRGPDSLRGQEHLLDGAVPAAAAEAVAFAELVLLALPWRKRAVLASYGPWTGKVVVDATNPYGEAGEVLDTGGRTSSELVADVLPGARVVKAFNTMHWMRLRDEGRPEADPAERLAVFLAGDDAEAKREVAGLVEELGFTAVDVGGLAEGGRLVEPGSALYNVPLVPAQALELLG